jgi:hypothetical protein
LDAAAALGMLPVAPSDVMPPEQPAKLATRHAIGMSREWIAREDLGLSLVWSFMALPRTALDLAGACNFAQAPFAEPLRN